LKNVQSPSSCVVLYQSMVAARGGGQRGHAPQKFLENIVILWFKRRFSKQSRCM